MWRAGDGGGALKGRGEVGGVSAPLSQLHPTPRPRPQRLEEWALPLL